MPLTTLSDNVVRKETMSALRTTRPTMRDVAVLAGVSLKTVSRVINDEPGVATATAARVSDAIAELGEIGRASCRERV